MPLPPLVVSGQVISAAHINAIRNALGTLGATLNANTNDITNVGTLTANIVIVSTVNANSIAVTTSISAASVTITGVLSGTSATFSAAVTTASLSVSGNLIGVTATFSGATTFNGSITAASLGVGAAASKTGPISTPSSVFVKILGSLHLGHDTQGGNGDGLAQFGQFGFVSGNNWSGVVSLGRNYALKSSVGADARYSPLTHGSIGAQGLEIDSAGSLAYAVTTGATTAGATITPTVRFKVTTAGDVTIGGLLSQSPPALGGATGNQAVAISSGVLDGANTVAIQIVNHRVSTGSGHGTIEQHLRRQVDGANMGYIGWGSNYVSIGTSTGVEMVRWSSNGRMRLLSGLSGSGAPYADNAAAVGGGLTAGEVYWTATGEVKRVI